MSTSDRIAKDVDKRITWNDVIKKEARGSDSYNLGEVQDYSDNWIHTQRGVASKTQYYLPRNLVRAFDGTTLWFNLNEAQASQYQRDSPADYAQSNQPYTTATAAAAGAGTAAITAVAGKTMQQGSKGMRSDEIQTIPLIEEKLSVSKRVAQSEATFMKEPVIETRTMDVPVTHEEVSVETRPVNGGNRLTGKEQPIDTVTTYRIPLQHEEVQITKIPQVKEEVVIKKTPVTENRKITETVRSERLRQSGNLSDASPNNHTDDEKV